ncbi:hypothetical protein [Mangrovihabitans endophyticus]|uniref:SHOCT domain-containing protein n=1 Tax=Mangrovihabitans endophyticus TaxID=1751298 RepID=A0A8J3C5C0_9ACTN|nr:hypothetical protein [Mangrovihabitans endophyticus]GGL10416.1 hypothetical protein GCM10012284_51450 [Mangrovihabitans endophyticus]
MPVPVDRDPAEGSAVMMGWYGGGMGWVGWLAMGLFWLLLIVVIVVLVVRLLPSAKHDVSAQGGAREDAPEDILDRRFARGEIDVDTYREQRAALVQARGTK